MNYDVLTQEDTDIWIGNLNKVIGLAEKLCSTWNDRKTLMDTQYKERYLTGWRRFFYDSDGYWLTPYSGIPYPYGGYFKLRHLDELTYAENDLRLYVECEYKEEKLLRTQERWSKYASQPFQINENDVIFYQSMHKFHLLSKKIAKRLGIDYEAFNLDEDSKSSS